MLEGGRGGELVGLKSQGRPRGRGGAQASWTSAGMGLHREKGSTQGRDVKRRDTGMRWGWGWPRLLIHREGD